MSNPFERHGLTHLSPSSINLYASAPALWCMEKLLKRTSPVGAAAHRGTAAEDGIAAGLFDPIKPVVECIEVANECFRRLTALSSDPRREHEGTAIAGIVKHGLEELRPYGVPSSIQQKVSLEFPDLQVPIIGYYDFYWEQHGILIDLKTQLKLASQIKVGHARQVSLYKAAISDNLDVRVCYCTDKKVATYQLENHREHLAALHRIALSIQRLLTISSDAEELTQLFAPDVDTFWYADGTARQNAFEVFGF